MIERTAKNFALHPSKLLGDSAYGSADMLGWLVEERGIEPHVTVFDKSARKDGTFARPARRRWLSRLCTRGRCHLFVDSASLSDSESSPMSGGTKRHQTPKCTYRSAARPHPTAKTITFFDILDIRSPVLGSRVSLT